MKINLSIETTADEAETAQALVDLFFGYQMLAINVPGLPVLEGTQVDLGEGKYRFDIITECNKSHIETFKEMSMEM